MVILFHLKGLFLNYLNGTINNSVIETATKFLFGILKSGAIPSLLLILMLLGLDETICECY